MSTATTRRATLDDLYREEGKAELIGEGLCALWLQDICQAGWHLTSQSACAFSSELRDADSLTVTGLATRCPNWLQAGSRFSPDASLYTGPAPINPMRFIEGAPTLAVEVRSENDYTAPAEAEIAAKRADYFAAGTLVVWDVDPQAETVVVYRASNPGSPAKYHIGDQAEAEPAAPGWRIAVSGVFAP